MEKKRCSERGSEGERDKKVAGKKRKECANIRRASLREKDEEGNKGKYISIFFTKKPT